MARKRDPYNKVKAYLIEHGVKHKDIADFLGMTSNTVTKKLNGFGGDFQLNDIDRLNSEFGIPHTLFFEPKVPKKERKKGLKEGERHDRSGN